MNKDIDGIVQPSRTLLTGDSDITRTTDEEVDNVQPSRTKIDTININTKTQLNEQKEYSGGEQNHSQTGIQGCLPFQFTPDDAKNPFDSSPVSLGAQCRQVGDGSLCPLSQPKINTDVNLDVSVNQPHIPSTHSMLFKSMGLTSEADIAELDSIKKDNPRLCSIFKNSDQVIHALKVISAIKPNQKFSTANGINIQSEITHTDTWADWLRHFHPVWFGRLCAGDDRNTNLRVIKGVFIYAFVIIEESLISREQLYKNTSNEKLTEVSFTIRKMKNEQLITRMSNAITDAIGCMQNLKKTYADDPNICARIDTLTETINDRLILTKTSLNFFK